MLNSITFSDGTGFKIDSINLYLHKDKKEKYGFGDSTKFRIFIPDWDKIINSEYFLDPFLKRYGIGQIFKFNFHCYLEYYKMVHFDSKGNYLLGSLKNIRNFNINSLEYQNLIWEIFTKAKELDKSLKKEDLKNKIEYQVQDVTGISVQELFMKAAYNDIADLEQTFIGQVSFTRAFYEKIVRYFKDIKSQYNSEKTYTKKEVEGLKKYLSEDPIFEELRSAGFRKVLEKVKEMILRYHLDNDKVEELHQLNKNHKIVEKKELDGIVKEALDVLTDFLKDRKDKERIERIKKWIDRIKYYHSQPEPVNLTVLVYINDRFSSKQGLIEHINLGLEMFFRRCYREWAKKIFWELNGKEHLSNPEKRLFILMHIGTPFLNYRTPIFDPLLIKYVNHKEITSLTFFLSSILKIHIQDDIDIKKLNIQLFLSFLKFYSFLLAYIRPRDTERKQNLNYRRRIIHDQLIDNTFFEVPELDEYHSNLLKKEIKPNKLEETDLSEFNKELDQSSLDSDDDLRYFSRGSSIDDAETLKSVIEKLNYETISVKKPGPDVKKIINFNLKELFVNDILESHCSEAEQELLRRAIINEDTLEEIGSDLKISAQAVHKKIKTVVKRLSKSSELEDILSELR